jgi:hypothetical protein
MLTNDPKLALMKCRFTDLSGRQFTMSAYQYALWSLDKDMRELIEGRIDPETAKSQYDELQKRKPIEGDTADTGAHFSFEELLAALTAYCDNYEHWADNEQWAAMKTHWCEVVGKAYRKLPAWAIYTMCEEGLDVAWVTQNFDLKVTRDSKHLKWWFERHNKWGMLGSDWAPVRGREGEWFSEWAPECKLHDKKICEHLVNLQPGARKTQSPILK